MAMRDRVPWILLLLITCASVLVGFVGFVVSQDRIRVRDAKAFCESLIPRLEAEKAQKGRYPEKLDPDWWKGRELPKHIKGREFYWSSSGGRTYAFGFPSASLLYDMVQYDPMWKRWTEYETH
jgi:hypothetical protein